MVTSWRKGPSEKEIYTDHLFHNRSQNKKDNCMKDSVNLCRAMNQAKTIWPA